MSEDRHDVHGEVKKVDAQGAAQQAAQGEGEKDLGLTGGAGGAKRGDDGKPSDVKMGFDVKMGAYDVKMGFSGEADKKK